MLLPGLPAPAFLILVIVAGLMSIHLSFYYVPPTPTFSRMFIYFSCCWLVLLWNMCALEYMILFL